MSDHWRWRDRDVTPGPAVVFDVDGVLADAAGRQHFIRDGYPDWDAFFEACGDDPLIDESARLLDVVDSELRIVLLTARPLRVQPQTIGWLQHHDLRWDVLIMRPYGDYLASRNFKQRSVDDLRQEGFELRLAVEDDRRNIEMFRSEGVPCLYVHSGYYE